MKRLVGSIIAITSMTFAFAVCDWAGSCFSGTGNCTTDVCGINCYEDSFGVEQFKCEDPISNDCCLCQYRLDTCWCTFGSGTQRIAKKWVQWGLVCDTWPCGQRCIGWNPPSLPL